MDDETRRAEIIEHTIDDLLVAAQEARTITRTRLAHHLGILAQRLLQEEERRVLMGLMTADDAAERLQVSARRVRARAAWLNAHGVVVGWKIPGTSVWLFLPRELEILRTDRGSGRPRKVA